MTTTPPTGPAPKTAPARGGYLILRKTDIGEWETVNTSDAASAPAAIRATVEKLPRDDQDGTFVAVPFRSWQPVKVTAKTTTTLQVEDAP